MTGNTKTSGTGRVVVIAVIAAAIVLGIEYTILFVKPGIYERLSAYMDYRIHSIAGASNEDFGYEEKDSGHTEEEYSGEEHAGAEDEKEVTFPEDDTLSGEEEEDFTLAFSDIEFDEEARETDIQAPEYKSGEQSEFAESLTPGLDMAAYFNTREFPDDSDMELLKEYLEETHEGNDKPSLFEDAETVVYPEGITLGWGVSILSDPDLTWSDYPKAYEGYGRCLINVENDVAEVTVERGELDGPYSGHTIKVEGVYFDRLESDYPGMGERFSILGVSDDPDMELTLQLTYFIIKEGRQYAIGWANWGDGTDEAWLLSRPGNS